VLPLLGSASKCGTPECHCKINHELLTLQLGLGYSPKRVRRHARTHNLLVVDQPRSRVPCSG